MSKRYNVPVRAPKAVQDELVRAAHAEQLTLAEYLDRLATVDRLAELASSNGLTGNAYINPRRLAAERVKEVAQALGCRQWDAWLALHRLKQAEEGATA